MVEKSPVVNESGQEAYEESPEYLREVLKYAVEIGSSLRLQVDS